MPRPRIPHLLPALLLAAACTTPPAPVPAPEPAGDAAPRWATVDVGSGHACALDTAGRAFCWGSNHDGQLGARTPETCAPSHHGDDHETCWASESDVPVAAASGMRFAALSVGGRRTCGLDGEGRAWCWGREVGTGTAGCVHGGVCSFDPVRLAPDLVFRTLRVEDDAVCGITPAGDGHCFRPRHGADRTWNAVRVAPGRTLALVAHHGDWMARDRHVICAVDEAGSAYCQGENQFAQLGTGDTIPRAEPVRVSSDARFAEIRVREDDACGLTTGGEVICWGSAAPRPSWPGGTPPEPALFACTWSAWCTAPRPAAAGLRFQALTLGKQSYCGLTAAGELHCWGMDGVPRPAAAELRFTAVEGERRRSCGSTADGSVWCWGDDVTADPARPIRVPDPPR